jgi:vacuolar-type H+-ATPase subunit I/STV1
MYRGTGTGLIGLGIVLVVIGAILKFAVTVTTSGLNINVIGVILLSVGIACCVIGAIVFGVGSFRQTTVRENVHMSPDGGQERVLQQRDTF